MIYRVATQRGFLPSVFESEEAACEAGERFFKMQLARMSEFERESAGKTLAWTAMSFELRYTQAHTSLDLELTHTLRKIVFPMGHWREVAILGKSLQPQRKNYEKYKALCVDGEYFQRFVLEPAVDG